MTLTTSHDQTVRPCVSRSRIAVVFLIVAYLLSGALHQCLDIDVTAPEGRIVVSMTPDPTDTGGPEIVPEHHCHGCFPVSLPNPPSLSMTIEPQIAAMPKVLSRASDLVPGIDTPPPKRLT
ncbi:MAG: hypothetical protein BGO16_16415 [Nitrobacter sp. 62-23]|nr:MAG: hypothetical protein BGO16_16415 [Nitrobacter sp. 62-23]